MPGGGRDREGFAAAVDRPGRMGKFRQIQFTICERYEPFEVLSSKLPLQIEVIWDKRAGDKGLHDRRDLEAISKEPELLSDRVLPLSLLVQSFFFLPGMLFSHLGWGGQRHPYLPESPHPLSRGR